MGSVNSDHEQDRRRFTWLKTIVKMENDLIIKYIILAILSIKIFLSMISAY
jgi:acyl-CoA thioesterase